MKVFTWSGGWHYVYLVFNVELICFSFIFSGLDGCKTPHYIWKDSTIVVFSCNTKRQFQHIQCNCMVRWQRLFHPYTRWLRCLSQKICRNSEMAQKQIWIHSSDIQIWWKGCECELFMFNWGLWEQKKVVINTRQVWMLVCISNTQYKDKQT